MVFFVFLMNWPSRHRYISLCFWKDLCLEVWNHLHLKIKACEIQRGKGTCLRPRSKHHPLGCSEASCLPVWSFLWSTGSSHLMNHFLPHPPPREHRGPDKDDGGTVRQKVKKPPRMRGGKKRKISHISSVSIRGRTGGRVKKGGRGG